MIVSLHVVHNGPRRSGKSDASCDAVCPRLKPVCGLISCWAVAGEEGARDKGSCQGEERWRSRVDDAIDEALSDMDGSESPDVGDEWRTWHMDDPELERDEMAVEREEEG